MSEANKQVVRSIEEAWDNNKLDELDRYFSPDFAQHSGVPGMPPGLSSAKMAHQMVMQAFPDRKMQILDIIGEGDKVFVRTRVTGHNKGGVAWLGAPEPNDRPIDFESWSVYALKGGKVIDHWGLNDAFTAMIQLGSLQPPMPPS
ncbi:MAG TPA: ester cyclase [Actinomycetota bacterium]|nr:ester cyclase [Actinomycetota bacterium]